MKAFRIMLLAFFFMVVWVDGLLVANNVSDGGKDKPNGKVLREGEFIHRSWLPWRASIGTRDYTYFRLREKSEIVNTVVIHHISAIDWNSPDSGLSDDMKRDALRYCMEENSDEITFSSAYCRALLLSYGVSAHYIISREGVIEELVPPCFVAFHAGKSMMPIADYREAVNEFSIGIELIGVHPSRYGELTADNERAYTQEQYQALSQLICSLKRSHPIKHIVGHDEISGSLAISNGLKNISIKTDPGPDFSWEGFRKQGSFELSVECEVLPDGRADYSPKPE